MRYRGFGRKIGWRPSALGFGCMRLPVLGQDRSKIDEPEATRMLRYAIDCGVNYVDTAYGYHGGNSEPFVGRALESGYRQKVRIATKSPTWLLKEPGDFGRYLEEQLQRLRVEQIDFYLLHGLGRERWQAVQDLGVLEAAEKARAAGLFAHLGFSFHDSLDCFKEIITGYEAWDFCQIQYNYLDTQHQAGTEGLHFAAGRGLGVVIMEPLRGGSLAGPGPASVQALWKEAPAGGTPADRALQWLWNQPEVSVVLSGMSAMSQVIENVASAGRSAVGPVSDEEAAFLGRVRQTYLGLKPINCTGCEYCLPCPQGIKIPQVFSAYNDATMFGTMERHRQMHSRIPEAERPGSCRECGECEQSCPQGLPVRDLMKRIHRAFSETAQ